MWGGRGIGFNSKFGGCFLEWMKMSGEGIVVGNGDVDFLEMSEWTGNVYWNDKLKLFLKWKEMVRGL